MQRKEKERKERQGAVGVGWDKDVMDGLSNRVTSTEKLIKVLFLDEGELFSF